MRNFWITSCVALISIVVSGCGDKFNVLQDVQPATGAQVRFIHAAPDAPAVDVYVNDRRISGAAVTTTNPTGSLLYSSSSIFPSAEYSSIPIGTTKLKIVAATNGTLTTPLLSADLEAEAGKQYSLFATGLAPTYSTLLVTDDIPAISGNTFFVRIVNLVPNATDVTLTYDGKDIIPTVAPGKASAFVSIPFPADYKSGLLRTANFQAKVNGAIPVTTGTIFYTGIQPGAAITYFVRGVMTTDAKIPTKYAVNLSSYSNR
ncbi:DUF4397 domain-containing protein [Spirosoma soli]|uniref:DUF4397 domain-containing protein n=1 Tax=Spirosoma soli TaxID=1770529 RepID=A0ABW5LZ18_9BACT